MRGMDGAWSYGNCQGDLSSLFMAHPDKANRSTRIMITKRKTLYWTLCIPSFRYQHFCKDEEIYKGCARFLSTPPQPFVSMGIKKSL